MQLRFATGGAAEGWAQVQMSASPFLVSSEEAVLHDMAHHPATLARYVVVEDGQVLGLTRVRDSRPGEVRALAACAAAGITSGGTGNDDANAPMLAVNDRLGYRPSAVTWSARRTNGLDRLDQPGGLDRLDQPGGLDRLDRPT